MDVLQHAVSLAFIGQYNSSPCGYCKQSSPELSRMTFGIQANGISADLYESMIHHNWRRCGSLFYFPYPDGACCPQYAIRLHASKIKYTRSQKSAVARLRSFLTGQEKATIPEQALPLSESNSSSFTLSKELLQTLKTAISSIPEYAKLDILSSIKLVPGRLKPKQTQVNSLTTHVAITIAAKLSKCNPDAQPCTAKSVADTILKHLGPSIPASVVVTTLENGIIEFSSPNISAPIRSSKNTESSEASTVGSAKKIVLRLQPATHEAVTDEFELYKKYQASIHGDNPSQLTQNSYVRFLGRGGLELQLNDNKKDEMCFTLQIAENQSTVRIQGFTKSQLPLLGYGTFHLRYELHEDGKKSKLLAVSVLDVLPTGLSSVYFFYSPEFSNLSLGVVSVLVEAELCKLISPDYWYYLGYYIHSCPKMKYKGQYQPSDILSPLTLEWLPIVFNKQQPNKDQISAKVTHSSQRLLQGIEVARQGLDTLIRYFESNISATVPWMSLTKKKPFFLSLERKSMVELKNYFLVIDRKICPMNVLQRLGVRLSDSFWQDLQEFVLLMGADDNLKALPFILHLSDDDIIFGQ